MDLQALKGILSTVKDPESGRNVVDTGQVQNLEVQNDSVSFTLELTSHSAPLWDSTIKSTEQTLRQADPTLKHVRIEQHDSRAAEPRPLGAIGRNGQNRDRGRFRQGRSRQEYDCSNFGSRTAPAWLCCWLDGR